MFKITAIMFQLLV